MFWTTRILIDRDCGKLTRHSKIVSNFVDNLLKEILLVMTFLRQLVASIVITQVRKKDLRFPGSVKVSCEGRWGYRWFTLSQPKPNQNTQKLLCKQPYPITTVQQKLCHQYFKCCLPDFDQTLKVGFRDKIHQNTTVLVTFVCATFVLVASDLDPMDT